MKVRFHPFDRSPRHASVRLRVLEPIAALRQAGVDAALADGDAVEGIDVLVLSKAYDERAARLAERTRAGGASVVFDLCDDHLHVPAGDEVRAARAERARRALLDADLVTTSTPALAAVLRDAGAASVRVVEDAIERPGPVAERWITATSRALRAAPAHEPLRLVWFGHAGTTSPRVGVVDLELVADELAALHRERPLRLTLVTGDRRAAEGVLARLGVPGRFVPWSRPRTTFELPRHDICVLPVGDTPVTRVKTANRPMTALLHGLPVVASPVPSYVDELGGWIAHSEWAESIARYAEDRELARRHVGEARAAILSRHTPERLAEAWRAALGEAAERRAQRQ